MCKTLTLRYTCAHHRTTRLSACRGAFTVQPRPGKAPRPACGGAAVVVLKAGAACGDCQRREAEEALDVWTAATAADSQELQAELYQLGKRFPSCRRYQSLARPGNGGGMESSRGSLLKREVLAEEVVVKWEAHRTVVGGAWDPDEWGAEYKSLSDELAEGGEEEAPSLGLPMTGCMDESMDEYCSAFGQEDGEGAEQSEWPDDAAWSTPWSSETEESPVWTPEEAAYWTSDPSEKDTTTPTAPSFKSQPTYEATPATSHNENDHENADALSPTEPDPPHPQLPTTSTSALTTRAHRPPAPHRPTFDDADGKMEIELRARVRCLRLPSFVCVGGE